MSYAGKGILAGTPVATAQQWLTEAQWAAQAIATGQREVTLNYGTGEAQRSVTFNMTNMGQLTAWIGTLQAYLGITRSPRRGMRFRFG